MTPNAEYAVITMWRLESLVAMSGPLWWAVDNGGGHTCVQSRVNGKALYFLLNFA